MIRHLARRFVNYFILTSIATIFAYMACSSFMDPSRRYQGKNPPIPQEAIDGILNEMGVNPKVPVLVRTWDWLVRIVTRGSLNKDFSGAEVTSQIALKAGISLRLLIVGAILAALVGVSLGVWGAVRQYKLSDQLITYTSYVLISTPTFVSGVLLMIGATWLNINVFGDQVLRFSGQYTPGITGFWPQFTDRINHLLLPTIALILLQSASYSRYQRAIMLDVLGSDYIRTARAKGATRTWALIKHGVRVALIPMSTYFAYTFGTLLGGATFLELVFSWKGMGQYAIDSVSQADVNGSVGSVAFAAILVLFSSMLAEFLYAALDPRVRV